MLPQIGWGSSICGRGLLRCGIVDTEFEWGCSRWSFPCALKLTRQLLKVVLLIEILLEKRLISIFIPEGITLNGWVSALLLSVVLVEIGGTLLSNRGKNVAGQATAILHDYSDIVALHKSSCTRRSVIAFLFFVCNVMPILFSLLSSRIIYILLRLLTLFLSVAIDMRGWSFATALLALIEGHFSGCSIVALLSIGDGSLLR